MYDENYFRQQIDDFINECCEFDESYQVSKISFLAGYTNWCFKFKRFPLVGRKLFPLLIERGFKSVKNPMTKVHSFVGVKLRKGTYKGW